MRTTLPILIAACVLLTGRTAFAHRIDEYLQATILSLEANRVQGSMRLIPGVLVSRAVIDSIDSNGDGHFSDSEERAYARRVLDDLTIRLDGTIMRPRLISCSFPEPSQMGDGLGEIHVEYTIDLISGNGDHSLIVANQHLSATSVYLVNVLIPQDSSIGIVAQKRNERQSLYELDFQQRTNPSSVWSTPRRRAQVWLNGVSIR